MKKAMVYGAGLSGMGAERLLKEMNYEVVMVDDRKAMSSEDAVGQLTEIDLFIKSPGIPYTKLVAEAEEAGIEVIDELELAYREAVKLEERPVIIAVTGTNGKTTVTTKIKEMLEYSGRRCEYAGNIGSSFAELVLDLKRGRILEYVVLEMSSYQLENLRDFKADIAMVVNLSPDHLDRYRDAKHYYDTKMNISMNQTEEDRFILNIDDPKIVERLSRISAERFVVSKGNPAADLYARGTDLTFEERAIARTDMFSLKGEHNLENMLFVAAVAEIAGVDEEQLRKFLYSTGSLEHRMEEFYRTEGTLFVNDSKGTNIDSTLMAVGAYEKPIVICGGADKKLDLAPLAKGLKDGAGEVYLIGEIADQLEDSLLREGFPAVKIKNEKTLSRTVERIAEEIEVSEDNVVLLSPATSSFDQFKNYLERGEVFKNLVKKHFEKGE